MIMGYMRDVVGVLQLRSASTGQLVRELPLPGKGAVGSPCGPKARQRGFLGLWFHERPWLCVAVSDPGVSQ